jgi:hypothetical protein
MSDVSKKLKELADQERILNERIRIAAPETTKVIPILRHPDDVRRDRRAKFGRTR